MDGTKFVPNKRFPAIYKFKMNKVEYISKYVKTSLVLAHFPEKRKTVKSSIICISMYVKKRKIMMNTY